MEQVWQDVSQPSITTKPRMNNYDYITVTPEPEILKQLEGAAIHEEGTLSNRNGTIEPLNKTYPSRGPPGMIELFQDAGCIAQVARRMEEIQNLASRISNPWTPFASAYEFTLASWLIKSGVSKSHINEFFNISLGRDGKSSFASSYSLRQILAGMNMEMGKTSWQIGEITFWSGKVAYHYRDPVAIVRFLIRQRAFVDELVYAPI